MFVFSLSVFQFRVCTFETSSKRPFPHGESSGEFLISDSPEESGKSEIHAVLLHGHTPTLSRVFAGGLADETLANVHSNSYLSLLIQALRIVSGDRLQFSACLKAA